MRVARTCIGCVAWRTCILRDVGSRRGHEYEQNADAVTRMVSSRIQPMLTAILRRSDLIKREVHSAGWSNLPHRGTEVLPRIVLM